MSESRKCCAEHRHTQTIQSQTCSGPSDRKRKHLWETKNKYKITLYVTGIERRFFFLTILFAPPERTAPGGFMGFRMSRNHEKSLNPQRCRVEEAASRRGVDDEETPGGCEFVWVPASLPDTRGGGRRRCLQNFLLLLP